MKKNTLKIILIFVVLMTAEFVFCQTPPSNRPPPPPGLPIDVGLFALFAVAIGYAVKEFKFKSK